MLCSGQWLPVHCPPQSAEAPPSAASTAAFNLANWPSRECLETRTTWPCCLFAPAHFSDRCFLMSQESHAQRWRLPAITEAVHMNCRAHQQGGHACPGAPGSCLRGGHQPAECRPCRCPHTLLHCSSKCTCWSSVLYHLVSAHSLCNPVPEEPNIPVVVVCYLCACKSASNVAVAECAALMNFRTALFQGHMYKLKTEELSVLQLLQGCTLGSSCFQVCNHRAACCTSLLAPTAFSLLLQQISFQLPSHRLCAARRIAERWALHAADSVSDAGHTLEPF